MKLQHSLVVYIVLFPYVNNMPHRIIYAYFQQIKQQGMKIIMGANTLHVYVLQT